MTTNKIFVIKNILASIISFYKTKKVSKSCLMPIITNNNFVIKNILTVIITFYKTKSIKILFDVCNYKN